MSRLLSIGLAVPSSRVTAAEALALARRLAPPEVGDGALEKLHRRSGVAERGAAAAEGRDGRRFFEPDAAALGPTTGERLNVYSERAAPLATDACADALSRAGVSPGAVTHLITASCTGFEAPGVDQAIMRALGLPLRVRRAALGFMGCHAAVNALAVADAHARADENAICLVCCVELCSLHYHYGARPDQLIANALFADGAAAAVVSARSPPPETAPPPESPPPPGGTPTIAGFGSTLFENSAGDMSWRIGDHGFEMTLAASAPDTLRRVAREWVGSVLDANGLSRADVGAWAIHPGGPKIVQAVAEALELNEAQREPSLAVLREHGNMSSPTALFVLRRLWDAGAPRPWVALAFGPGLAAEAVVIR